MPRKYKDGDIVRVYYSTRSRHLAFIGRVTDYVDKKYRVLYLCESSGNTNGTYRFSNDMIFSCWVYEMSELPNDHDYMYNVQKSIKRMYAGFCEDMLINRNWYSTPENKVTKMVYQAFKVKRLLDWDFTRVFPVVQLRERGEYFYDY